MSASLACSRVISATMPVGENAREILGKWISKFYQQPNGPAQLAQYNNTVSIWMLAMLFLPYMLEIV